MGAPFSSARRAVTRKQAGFPTRERTAMSRWAPLIQGERTSSRGMRAWMPPRERSRLCPASHRRTRSSSTVFCSMASRRLWSVKEEGGRRPSGGYSLFSGIL